MLRDFFEPKMKAESRAKNFDEIEIIEEKEYGRYTQEMEGLLSLLESKLQQTEEPEKMAQYTLEAVCNFYQGDLCAILDVDLELKLWSPFWWYSPETEKIPSFTAEGCEPLNGLERWMDALKSGRPVKILDAELIRESHLEEYALYKRLGVGSIIGVPFWKDPSGFLIVRNPKKYTRRTSLLQFLTFMVIASVNERKLMDSVSMTCSADGIQNDTDIVIHVFGELKIYTSKGVLKESDMKSPKISRLITYMVLNQKRMLPSREIAEHIWPKETFDSENPGRNIKGLLYRFRQMFGLISDYNLIETTVNGYRLNPKLHIMTDLDQFDMLKEAAQKTRSPMKKAELLKKAVELYKGDVLTSARSEEWLMHTAWGITTDFKEITISLSEHKTTKNLATTGAFTVSMATEDTVIACDYVGVESGNTVPNKFEKAGFHATKSTRVNAPLIDELPMALECKVKSYENGILIGEIVNVCADESVITDGKIDTKKLKPITFDPCNNTYIGLGEVVGKAFSDGMKLK